MGSHLGEGNPLKAKRERRVKKGTVSLQALQVIIQGFKHCHVQKSFPLTYLATRPHVDTGDFLKIAIKNIQDIFLRASLTIVCRRFTSTGWIGQTHFKEQKEL